MISRSVLARSIALAFGGSLFVGVAPVFAQTQEQPQQLEKVEITGSSIKRIEAEGALPVQVFTRQEIDRTGATTTAELVQRLPAMQGFTSGADSVGGGGGGFLGASLHNVGESRTLVLLNGRRLASYGGQSLTGGLAAIDLNTIPLAAIERVEILSDGASALYGADAIGGVINFITKKNFSDGQIAGSYNQPQKSGGASHAISAVKGFGDLEKDGYNAMIGLTSQYQQGLMGTQRDFSKTGNILFGYNGQTVQFFNGSPRTIPANIDVPSTAAATSLSNYYAFTHNGACPPVHILAFGVCYYDYASQLEISPEQRKDSATLSFSKKLGDQTLFANVVYAQSTVISTLAPPPGEIPIPMTSPLWAQYAQPQGATGDTTAHWRVADVGGRKDLYESNALNIVLGMEGVLAGWDYSGAYTHSTNDYNDVNQGGWLKLGALEAALASGTLNPFLEPGQQSAAGMAALNGAKINGVYDGGKSTLDNVELHGSREIFTLPAGPASLGTGANVTREAFTLRSSDIAQGIGDIRFGDIGGEVPYSASRTAVGVFGELLTPIAKGLELTTSVRDDHYSDFGNSVTGKLAARFQPTKTLLFRASYGAGFKAPTVSQVKATKQLFGVTSAPYVCPFTAAQLTAMFGGSVYCPSTPVQFTEFQGGNNDLKPEKSRQWDLGVRVEPNDALSAGLDLWRITLRDTIGQVDESTVMGDPARYIANFTAYNDPVTGKTLALNFTNLNLGQQIDEGVDLDVKARFKTPVGTYTSQLIATYMIKSTYELLPGSGFVSDLGTYNNGAVTLRWQGRWINTLDYGPTSHSLTMNFKSGYADQAYTATDCYVNLLDGTCIDIHRRVDQYITFDWQSRWNVNKTLALTVGVTNLLDKDPPLTIKTTGGGQVLGFDGRYADPLGRVFYANVKIDF